LGTAKMLRAFGAALRAHRSGRGKFSQLFWPTGRMLHEGR
jgi:hypothetical protein